MEILFVKSESKAWDAMWNNLAIQPINKGLKEPTVALYQHEAWEYMGSVKNDNEIAHEFRHRCHPKTKSREYVRIFCKRVNKKDIGHVVKIN